MVKHSLVLLASALGLMAVSSVRAETITFDFTNCNRITSSHVGCPSDLGTSTATFSDTTGAYQVQVTGLDQNQQPTDLALAWNGLDQKGLGLASVPDSQVGFGSSLSIDLSGLSQLGAFGGMLTLEDLTAGEQAMACSSACFGLSGSAYPPLGETAVMWSPGDQALEVFVPDPGAGNFLLGSLTVGINPPQQTSPVPEPGSAALFALGLAGLILISVGRRRSAA